MAWLLTESNMPKAKRQRLASASVGASSSSSKATAASNQTKKLKLLASHALESPFPNFHRPTPTEAREVYHILAAAHPQIAPSTSSAPSGSNSNAATTCGKVPNVLESLIGTILSQNTSGKNSTAAKRSLDERFGRNNFEAIVNADNAEVVDAIRMGGLANKKATVIQRILKEVKERHGAYSLQHLAGVIKSEEGVGDSESKVFSDEDAMKELVSYDGVGPKTASCVLLFSLGRASFPVDTHVFRISRFLGWVPAKADRVTAQAHLDLKIPDDLKHDLHVLMVGHGRKCTGCRGKGDCPLKAWLKTRNSLDDEDLETMSVKAEELTEADGLKVEEL